MIRFVQDFIVGVIGFALATAAAVVVSYVLLITIFGPLIWLFVFYGSVAAFILRYASRGRFGFAAAAVFCLAGWALYAEIDAMAARDEARKVASENASFKRRPVVEAVTFRRPYRSVLCDSLCTELLAGGFVKTVFVEIESKAYALTLASGDGCDGKSAEASAILREKNRFDVCIRNESVPPSATAGLLFEQRSALRHEFADTRSTTTFLVSERDGDGWRLSHSRTHGRLLPLGHVPIFAGFFTGSGRHGVWWWRRTIELGKQVDMSDVVSETLSIELTRSFDAFVTERKGTTVMSRRVTPPPAVPAELAAAIDRMSRDVDPKAQEAAAKEIQRFVRENRTYHPVRASLERLLASPHGGVKGGAYNAIAHQQMEFDAELLRAIMDGGPAWGNVALGTLLGRFPEGTLVLYEARIIEEFFKAEQQYAQPRFVPALFALRRDALAQVFADCTKITSQVIVVIGDRLESSGRSWDDEKKAKFNEAVRPCLVQRFPTLTPGGLSRIAKGLAQIGEGELAIAAIEQRLAEPREKDRKTDLSNLKSQLDRLRQPARQR